jgi:sugar phosphate permease
MSAVLTLLVLSVFINYVDRGNLSIAAPLLKSELGISASRLGILLSSFFWTYTAMLFVCGWFVDRLDVNRVLALGFLVWSLATAATGIVHGVRDGVDRTADSRHGPVGGVPVLLKDFGAALAGV